MPKQPMEWSAFSPAMPSGNPLKVIIQGIAQRTASAVNDWIFGMKNTGMSDAKIKARLGEELEVGRIISEMRRFATANVPGYTGELLHRFGRDTLMDDLKIREADAILASQGKRTRVETDNAAAAKTAWEKQGIDTTSWTEGKLPDPPPDADLNEVFKWIAVMDSNTCGICGGNHGREKTLREWSEIGEPRSGACRGERNCRCMLIPTGVVKSGDIPESIRIPR